VLRTINPLSPATPPSDVFRNSIPLDEADPDPELIITPPPVLIEDDPEIITTSPP
jgi:hypothetical protein